VSSQNSITLCLGAHCVAPAEPSSAEHLYQTVYKPLVSALYNLPNIPFTFAFDGPILEWMEQHHPEFFMILEEMVGRKQVEILGGGYYSPFFPLLPPADRVGQIELLTTQVRKNFGRRPRGCWLESSAWEPSMISSLTSCGMEYVLLDRMMIASSGFPGVDGWVPVNVEDCGKTLLAFPLDLRGPLSEHLSPAAFLDDYLEGPSSDDGCLGVFFHAHALPALFSGTQESPSWMERLQELSPGPSGVLNLSTPGKTIKRNRIYRKIFIQAGISSDFAQTGSRPHRSLPLGSVKHALYASRSGMNLYAKMMYVHVLVNQLRGDKARKKNAREELWRSQSGTFYGPEMDNPEGCERSVSLRNRAYKHLLLAEKSTRLRGVFSPSIVSFDFDMDGMKEWLCQLETLNMYAHLQGGRLFEIDHFRTNRNFVDICRRHGGFFVDHFLDRDEVAALRDGNRIPGSPVFADRLYQDVSVDSSKLEMQFRANGLFGPLQQPISLKKNYAFRNEGVQVQYILKNESPLNLAGSFATSVDLAVTETRGNPPAVSLYTGENRFEGPVESLVRDDVEWIRIDDGETRSRFTLEPNENAFVTLVPYRSTEGTLVALRLYLHWNVELGPNYETEKTVFLKIDLREDR